MESIFFMSIYESNKDEFKSRDRDRYEATLKTFNELKKLGIDSDINKLDSKLKDILIDSLFKNQDKLKDELNFIKSYFGFVGKNNLKITKISKNLFKLVEEYKKENKFKNIEIKFNDIAEDIEKKEQNKKEENDIKIIEDNKNSIIDIQGHIKTGKDNLIKEIKKLEDNFLLEEKKNKNIEFDIINKENNPQNFIFNSFYKKIFETNFGFAKLDDKEFYDEIIYKAKKLYVHGIRLGLMNKMDNNNEFLLLITEFYNIIEAYELSNKNNKYNECKKFFFPLLHLIYEYYNNKDEKKIMYYINEIINLLKNNQEKKIIKKKIFYDLLIEILMKEKRKNNNKAINEILISNLIFSKKGNDFDYFNDDLMIIPFIDEVLFNYFNYNKIEKINETIFDDISKYLDKINEIIEENKIFEEKILFYFETKIRMLFDQKYNNGREFFNKEKESFDQFINLLESLKKGHTKNKKIKELYSIAFIKCFLNKLIDFTSKNNEEIGDISGIKKYLIRNSEIMTSIKMYILKLLFDNTGNFNDFYDDYFSPSNYFKFIEEDEKIKPFLNKDDLQSESLIKSYGFDYMIIPLKEDNKNDFAEFLKDLNEIKKMDIEKEFDDSKLMENLNKNNYIDFLYCGILNSHFSFYYTYQYEEKIQIDKWILNKINNNQIEILNKNEILKNILLLFIAQTEKEKYNIQLDGLSKIKQFNYNKLLCLLISARYVLKTVSDKNEKGFFYNLVIDPLNVLSNYQIFFEYYLKAFDIFSKMDSDISYLTYRFINYIILSHLYFGYLLGNINLNNNQLKSIFGEEKINNENYLENSLFNEFDFIKDILKLVGINKKIIYFNNIFEEVSDIIIKIKLTNKDDYMNYIKSKESDIDNEIKTKVTNFNDCVEDYFKSKELIESILGGENKNEKYLYREMFIETNYFYNKKQNSFPYSYYLTSTNFCTFDDFKMQRLFFVNEENKNYPMIDCILKKERIMEIIDLLPRINRFINDIYNELILKISEEDMNKEIKETIKDIQKLNIDTFNKSLKKLINLCNKNINLNITEKSKISDVINIKDNIIYKIYEIIIEEYNEFLSKMNYIEDTNESVIIQNCSENEFINFRIYDNNKKENISAEERLCQIIYLYSNRNRIKEDNNNEKKDYLINVSNGGKISYDCELIEKMLEKEILFGKKHFSSIQKTFIFSNNVFSKERNKILDELYEKYPQREIDKNIKDKLIQFMDTNSKDTLFKLYYNIQYIIVYLMTYEKENKYDGDEITINDLIKIIENCNFKISDKLKDFMKNGDLQSLYICHLLSFYEIIELKAFEYLTKDIKNNINKDEIKVKKEYKEKILQHLNKGQNDLLIKKDILENGIKKYILRYCLGDYKEKDKILENLNTNFKDIFERKDIWEYKIFKDENKFKEESRQLIEINQKENCIVKYFYNIIFGFVNDNDNDKEELLMKNDYNDYNDDGHEDDDIMKPFLKKKTKEINNDDQED